MIKDTFRRAFNRLSIFQLLLISFAIKSLYFILFSRNGDLNILYWDGMYFFKGDLPYRDFYRAIYVENEAGFHIYPPGFYYFLAFLDLIFNQNATIFNYGTRIIWNIFDGLTCYGVYLIAKRFFSEAKSKVIAAIYLFNPLSIYFLGYFGLNESLTLTLAVFGVYFFLKEKYGVSAFVIGLGTLFMLMPGFYILAFVPFLWKKRQYTQSVMYVGEVIGIYLLASLPLLFSEFEPFIAGQELMIARSQSGEYLLSSWLPFLMSPIYTISFVNFGITPKLLIQIGLLGTLFGLILRNHDQNKEDYLDDIFLIQTFFCLLTFTNHVRLPYWLFPWLLLFYFRRKNLTIDMTKFNHFFNYMVIISLGVSVGTFFYELTIGSQISLNAWYIILIATLIGFQIVWILLHLKFDYEKSLVHQFVILIPFSLSSFYVVFYQAFLQLTEQIKLISIVLVLISVGYFIYLYLQKRNPEV